MAPNNLDDEAKQFSTTEDKSGLYIYRNETFGAAIKMPVSLDGKLLGQTAAKTYFHTEVEPGDHTINSVTENTSSLRINTRPGQNYYVWQEVKMGLFTARSRLHLVDEAKGKEDVLACKLIHTNQR